MGLLRKAAVGAALIGLGAVVVQENKKRAARVGNQIKKTARTTKVAAKKIAKRAIREVKAAV